MINILVIAQDQRALEMVSRLRPRFLGTIAVAGTFDQGLQEFYEKRPAVVLVQQRMDGTNSELVANQIKSLLRDEAPRLFLLCNDSAPPTRSAFDATVDLSQPIENLDASLLQLLSGLPGFRLRQDAAVPQAAPPDAAEERQPVGVVTVSAPPSRSTPGGAQEGGAVVSGNRQTMAEARVDRARPKTTAPGYLVGIPVRPARSRSSWYLLAVLLVVATGALLLQYANRCSWWPAKAGSVLQHAADAKRPASKAASRAFRLPAVVLQARPDPAYGKTHPGWERFEGDGIEFHLFREKQVLQAIQVIGYRQGVITDAFFASFVRDLCGSRPLPPYKTAKVNGFLVESGRVDGGAEYLLYRRSASKAPSAFVVSLPPP